MNMDVFRNRTGAASDARLLQTRRRALIAVRSRYFSISEVNSTGSRSIVLLSSGSSDKSIRSSKQRSDKMCDKMCELRRCVYIEGEKEVSFVCVKDAAETRREMT